ncbi:isocitrate lyase/phosphoenolpyruvate mutase family protein [Desulfobacca acetoxidans]|uniref:Phosphoenolpyruvate phosphomutase n=1 Tax=Desulfobacca acetoxidans (strain ATCC 700848 / DSM 11109 / ASRB2) TaxID=880072 RepID=F2NFH3_DESAR|nr:isocitrate lyase/phosphoenolpyruvate mutase family protein [Desulfobacca acetoxidans]AEB10092.1 phosphoenolpyruvate phosphomutase [Desulfobacca acetoxidans DSM 11109]
MHDKAQALRRLLARPGIIQVAGAHNGLGARLVEEAGFDAVWASGLEISAANAVPDANILTMTDYQEAAANINEATDLPVIADCDTGYGNYGNVIRLIKKYEALGIAAVCIEDKCFPKVNSYIPGRQELAPLPEFVGKIMAAKDAQISAAFMVIARVEALIAGWGLEEAWRRAEAYAAAGADAILIHSKAKTPDEIQAFIRGWRRAEPLVVVPTSYSQVTVEELAAWGVKIVIYANAGLRAAVRAMSQVLRKLRQAGSLAAVEADITPMSTIFELQDMPRLRAAEKKYSCRPYDDYTVIIPAAGRPQGGDRLSLLLTDQPAAMLPLKGKPLLQHNVETLRRLGLDRILVITGYKAEAIDITGIKTVFNPDFAACHILHSIMQAGSHFNRQTLLIYADILFEPFIIQKLLDCRADIVLVVDNSFRYGYNPNKNLDLVVAREKPLPRKRRFLERTDNLAMRIGHDTISDAEADYEFIGIVKSSAAGTKALKEIYDDCRQKYQHRPFHEAATFYQASFTDLLQEVIDRGLPVKLLEVNSGWMEIQTFEDYQRALSLFNLPGQGITAHDESEVPPLALQALNLS